MKEEQLRNIAIAAIVIIIAVVLSFKLISTYNPDFFDNLFAEEKKIEIGDSVQLNFVGRYASNGTIFDTSNEQLAKDEGIYNENKTYEPMKVYVAPENNTTPPQGYTNYSTVIEGLQEALIGMKEGQEKNNITIPPGKAYGYELKEGVTFNTSLVAGGTNITVEVTNVTNGTLTLRWINIEEGENMTMPQAILQEDVGSAVSYPWESLPPHWIWENASEVIDVTNDTITISTTPTKGENLSEQITPFSVETETFFIFPDATFANWTKTTITVTSSPVEGTNYSFSFQGQSIPIQIENVSEDKINVSISFGQQTQYLEVNRTVEFNRTITLPRVFTNITSTFQQYYLQQDLQKGKFSTHRLAGETLVFDVTIKKIHKTSS